MAIPFLNHLDLRSVSEQQKDEELALYNGMANSIEQARDAFEDPRDELTQSEVPNIPVPQVPQMTTQPTEQVTAQQVQQLFPFDTTAAAIAQRRQNRG